MTTLEKRILKHGTKWSSRRQACITVVGGLALAVYQKADHTRFCALTKKDTLKWIASRDESFWISGDVSYHDRMFDIVASREFAARVILNALPELEL